MSQVRERGFSLIEVMIAMSVVSVGMLGLLALFAQAVAISQVGSDDLVAKQLVREMLEGIYTARNTNQLSFSMIRNSSQGGVFNEGYQPVRTAGADGLGGTDDDGEVASMQLAGPDGLLGTEDDQTVTLDNYEREVIIEDINQDLRKVVIAVRYESSRGLRREYKVSSYVSRFR